MERVINFGKHKGTTYLQVPIEYLIWLSETITKEKDSGDKYDIQRLETVDYWLEERYLEYDQFDKQEEWATEHQKIEENKKVSHKINMNLTSKDIAKFIIGTYGYDLASLIADDIKDITSDIDEIKIWA